MKYVSAADLAETLGVSEWTIRRERLGRLRPVTIKVRGQYRFDQERAIQIYKNELKEFTAKP